MTSFRVINRRIQLLPLQSISRIHVMHSALYRYKLCMRLQRCRPDQSPVATRLDKELPVYLLSLRLQIWKQMRRILVPTPASPSTVRVCVLVYFLMTGYIADTYIYMLYKDYMSITTHNQLNQPSAPPGDHRVVEPELLLYCSTLPTSVI